jgi:hypothetical protein
VVTCTFAGMTTGSSDGVTVVFETTATEDEIRAVKDTLAEFNLQWPIATDAEPEPRGGIGDIPPLVQFVAVYGIARFFDAFLAEAGKSAYQRFSEFLVDSALAVGRDAMRFESGTRTPGTSSRCPTIRPRRPLPRLRRSTSTLRIDPS